MITEAEKCSLACYLGRGKGEGKGGGEGEGKGRGGGGEGEREDSKFLQVVF